MVPFGASVTRGGKVVPHIPELGMAALRYEHAGRDIGSRRSLSDSSLSLTVPVSLLRKR